MCTELMLPFLLLPIFLLSHFWSPHQIPVYLCENHFCGCLPMWDLQLPICSHPENGTKCCASAHPPELQIILQLTFHVCRYPSTKCPQKGTAGSAWGYAPLSQQTSWVSILITSIASDMAEKKQDNHANPYLSVFLFSLKLRYTHKHDLNNLFDLFYIFISLSSFFRKNDSKADDSIKHK